MTADGAAAAVAGNAAPISASAHAITTLIAPILRARRARCQPAAM
jgi:hypothetical protein